MTEPRLRVGLIQGAHQIAFELPDGFRAEDGSVLHRGTYKAREGFKANPAQPDAVFAVSGVEIGIGFHWNKKERQKFRGSLEILRTNGSGLTLVNELGLEAYLESVITSEMSEGAHPELLKAHAVISRSWVVAQMERPRNAVVRESAIRPGVISRWYDRENHETFDFCADDHCQRYQGVTKATTAAASNAVAATRAQVLVSEGTVCDTRYSKSCGGMTEKFSSAWEDSDVAYLTPVYDGSGSPDGFTLPLSAEANARDWITSSPEAFCNTNDPAVLNRILPDFDRATQDFYRWKVSLTQDEVGKLLLEKLGSQADLGAIHSIVALERGPSSRIVRLLVTGEKGSLEVGKELEIRRILSTSHLYSSAFIVETVGSSNAVPDEFVISGAGWGHGVGLCQIGAAVMADQGYKYEQILSHYFRGAELKSIYD